MELNTLKQCHFKSGSQQFEIDYFLTRDSIGSDPPLPEEVRLVLSIRGSQDQKHYIAKSVSIMRQPKEVIEIIVRREALALIDRFVA